MSNYKKWNTALIDHFFTNNDKQEVILYCDEEVIDEIGKNNNIGTISDFVEQVIDEEKRIQIYDSYFNDRQGNLSTTINRNIKTSKGLKFSLLLHKKGIVKKVPLTYFSFIIVSILKHKLDDNKKEELGLNKIGSNPSGYDDLFYDIEKNYPNFIARKIGKHRYEGLIKFQVVLNRNENTELDKILFDKNLQFSEDEGYESILNRVIRYSNGSLREKLEQSIKDECYKIWFENKIKSFDIDKYCTSNNLEKKSTLEGEFALALFLSTEFRGLKLLTNVNPEEAITDGDISISNTYINSRLENGFFLNTVNINSNVEIKEYCFADKEKNISIKSLKLNDVIIFQKIKEGVYVQTINPYPNELTFTLIKNETKIVEKFKKWCEKKKVEIEDIAASVSNDLIGSSYLIVESKDFHTPYYKIDKTYLKVDNNLLKVKKFGGYRPSGTLNTYLDVALPQFKLTSINDFDSKKFKVEFIRKDASVKDKKTFGYNVIGNIVNVFIEDKDFNLDTTIFVEINFTYDKNDIGSFDFGIEASKMKKLDDEKDFVKLNKWGVVTTDQPYYNIKTLEGAEKVNLNTNAHTLDFKEDSREYSNYLINLLCAAFYKTEKNYLDKQKLKDIYESALIFLRTIEVVNIEENEYSFNNLLKHLLELGYLQKGIKKNDNGFNEVYFAIPPTFSRIEKAFSHGGGQVYLLTGLYSRSFLHYLKSYLEEKSIKTQYRKFSDDKNRFSETYLLPDLIFIDHNFSIEEFKEKCEENGFYFETETIHNVPNSLLNFVASIDDFENDNLDLNQKDNASIDQDKILQYKSDLEPAKETEFPRLRVLKTDKAYIQKTKFIEYKENEFLRIRNKQLTDWLDIYIKYLRKEPFIVFEKKRSEGNYIYTSELFTYKYTKLPNLISKALTHINVGVPSEQKLFIVNSTLNKRSKEFAFNIFYRYNISNNTDRRKQIVKTLTGSDEIENNVQIINSTRNNSVNITMELLQPIDKKYCDSFIMIKDGVFVNALIKLGNNSKPEAVFVKSEKSNESLEIKVDKKDLKMVAIDLGSDNINLIISNIIKGNFKQLKFLSSKVLVDVLLEEYSKENIKIIDNY